MKYVKYEINNSITIHNVEDGKWIPLDESNTDYQAYLAWVAEGNVAEEWNQ